MTGASAVLRGRGGWCPARRTAGPVSDVSIVSYRREWAYATCHTCHSIVRVKRELDEIRGWSPWRFEAHKRYRPKRVAP